MSYPLEPIDLLVDVSKVLYNERIVEQRKQIEELKDINIYVILQKMSNDNPNRLFVSYFSIKSTENLKLKFKSVLLNKLKEHHQVITNIDIEHYLLDNPEHNNENLYKVLVHRRDLPDATFLFSYMKLKID
jgi:hypothetical protein